MTTAGGRTVLGIDLGGTKIEGAIFSVADDVPVELARKRVPTRRDDGYDAILGRVASLAFELTTAAGLGSLPPVGVGMPGGITRRTGAVKNSNATCLNGRPFRDDLAHALGVPVRFANDANCFALAEARFGAAREFSRGVVFGVILGSGVGGGIVMRGEVWDGPQGIGGEWGHHVLEPRGKPCYCGRQGCVERYLAGPDVERAYAQRSGERRALRDIVLRREVDEHARAVADEMIDAFGRALGNVISILDPDIVVLGGGVSNVDLLYDEGRGRVAANVFNDELTTPIVRADLGDSAGVIGAGLLVA